MNLRPRFLGTVVKHNDLKPGDLFLSEDASGTRLILVLPNGSDVCGLLLNEWGSTSPSPYYPKMLLHLHGQSGYQGRVRRIDGDITVEPLEATSEAVVGKHDWEHNNGTLCFTLEGDPAIYVKWEQFLSLYKLASGGSVEMKGEWPYIARKQWKLVWNDGNDAVTLCEFGKPQKA